MSEQGMRIWNESSQLTFTETDFTLRVISIAQIRLGYRSGTVSVSVPLAAAGMYAVVNVLPGSYTGWAFKHGVRASLPTVTVGNGELLLSAAGGTSYLANIDVIVVGSL